MLVLAVGEQTFNGMKAAPLQVKDLYKTKLQEQIYTIGAVIYINLEHQGDWQLFGGIRVRVADNNLPDNLHRHQFKRGEESTVAVVRDCDLL